MTTRATQFQKVQIGVETTPGTAVAATKTLRSLSIEPGVKATTKQFRPIGSKDDALSVLTQEYSEAKVAGQLTFSEIVYALASVVGGHAVTDLDGGTGAHQHDFESVEGAADTVVTYTVEQGDASAAHKVAGLIFDELAVNIKKSSGAVDVSGKAFAGRLQTGQTLTATGVSDVELVPVSPEQITVYCDTTGAGLGTTVASSVLSADVKLSGRFGRVWTLDASKDAYTDTVETKREFGLSTLHVADTDGLGHLSALRAGDTRFFRIEAVGALVPGSATHHYKVTVDLACQVKDVKEFSDDGGVYAIGYDWTVVRDAAWGRSHHFTVVNAVAAL